MQAVETGYALDISNFQPRERGIFGQLLSSMFVEQWRKAMASAAGTEEEKILENILTWPPFPSFLKILSM